MGTIEMQKTKYAQIKYRGTQILLLLVKTWQEMTFRASVLDVEAVSDVDAVSCVS